MSLGRHQNLMVSKVASLKMWIKSTRSPRGQFAMIFKDMVFKHCRYNDSAQGKETWESVARFRAATEGWEMPRFRGSGQCVMYHSQHCQKALRGKNLS